MQGLAIDISMGPSRAAIDLLEETLVQDDMISLPIDVEGLAQRIGLVVQRMVLPLGTDGMLVRDVPYEKFKAVLDANAPVHRARFTRAHEIGHFIHKYQDFPENKVGGILEKRSGSSSRGTESEEIWANQFAAALLMPPGIVAELWGEGLSIEEMAEMFNVSDESMTYRIQNLGLR